MTGFCTRTRTDDYDETLSAHFATAAKDVDPTRLSGEAEGMVDMNSLGTSTQRSRKWASGWECGLDSGTHVERKLKMNMANHTVETG